MNVRREYCRNNTDGENPMHLEIKPSQCHFIDHKPHTDWHNLFSHKISFYIHSRTVKYAADLCATGWRRDTVLQGMSDTLDDVSRCYEMEMNLEIIKLMRISRQSYPVVITWDQKQADNVEYSNYLGSLTTNGTRRTRDIKSSIAMAKAVFRRRRRRRRKKKKKKKKKALLTRKLGINLRKATRTLRKVDQKYFASFEMWRWRRTESSVGPIVWKMKKYYKELRRTGISCIQ